MSFVDVLVLNRVQQQEQQKHQQQKQKQKHEAVVMEHEDKQTKSKLSVSNQARCRRFAPPSFYSAPHRTRLPILGSSFPLLALSSPVLSDHTFFVTFLVILLFTSAASSASAAFPVSFTSALAPTQLRLCRDPWPQCHLLLLRSNLARLRGCLCITRIVCDGVRFCPSSACWLLAAGCWLLMLMLSDDIPRSTVQLA